MTDTPPERQRADALVAAARALDILNIADEAALLRTAEWILGERTADNHGGTDGQ